MRGKPPYIVTPKITGLIVRIGEALGRVEALGVVQDLRLRRVNRIRTIHGSCAIEGNTLSEDEVTALLDGKRVIAPARDIREILNAYTAYEECARWNGGHEADLLQAHGILMDGLLDKSGRYRLGNVRVGNHIAPSYKEVPQLMSNLFEWLNDTDEHPLIVSAVFHYEFEFIHPFLDGNGRMGRLWQTLILAKWRPLFEHIPVESMVYANQQNYYKAIRDSSAIGESTPFIEFVLKVIHDSLLATDQVGDQVTDQVARLILVLRRGEKTATELMTKFQMSHRPNLRANYLSPALNAGLIEMTNPDSPTAKNQKYRLTAKGRAFRR